jgi:hypothetical protein
MRMSEKNVSKKARHLAWENLARTDGSVVGGKGTSSFGQRGSDGQKRTKS